jgi:hypothetical protein
METQKCVNRLARKRESSSLGVVQDIAREKNLPIRQNQGFRPSIAVAQHLHGRVDVSVRRPEKGGMRTTEILDLLRENPGSYIESTLDVYCIRAPDGARLVDYEPVYEQVRDLVRESRIRPEGNNRYILA